MIRVVVLGLNDVGERLLDWLEQRDDTDVVAVLTDSSDLDRVAELAPDLLLSLGFRHIVPESVLSVPDRGAVNVHKSYLPYNRGANPNVWSIVEDNPAGVSIHYMTSEVDAGPIIDRRHVPVEPDDDGRDLYERLEAAQIEQFEDVWPEIRDGTADTVDQTTLPEGTVHRKRDFVDLWELDRAADTTVGNLLDRLRALTFPPFKNAFFDVDGERYYVDVSITPAASLDDCDDGCDDDSAIPEYDEETGR
jgi:methionyl-tRNA formyltransferase